MTVWHTNNIETVPVPMKVKRVLGSINKRSTMDKKQTIEKDVQKDMYIVHESL